MNVLFHVMAHDRDGGHGKCLDVEVTSKVRRGCQKIERESDLEKEIQKESHIYRKL